MTEQEIYELIVDSISATLFNSDHDRIREVAKVIYKECDEKNKKLRRENNELL